MYLQEVVISPDIFELISKAFSENFEIDLDLKSYKKNLYLKKILLDRDVSGKSFLYNRINKIKESSSDFGKSKIDLILRIFDKSGRQEYKILDNKKTFSKQNKIHNQLLNLALHSDSRIINSEDSTLKLHKKNHPKELKEIEILNFDEFIKPSPENPSSIYSLEKTIKIQKGNGFQFENYFKPYLQEEEDIVIQDRYLRIKDRGYYVLCKILELCRGLKTLRIKTITRENNIKDDFDMTTDIFKNSLRNKFINVDIDISNTYEHPRKIFTSLFEITVDPGFGELVDDDKNFNAYKNSIEINFQYIKDSFNEILI